MQFDLGSVETATLVFIGTLVFGFLLAAFVLVAGLVALVLLGAGKLSWAVVSGTLLAVVQASMPAGTGWCTTLPLSTLPGTFRGKLPLAPELTRG